jgi:hypothetical protein
MLDSTTPLDSLPNDLDRVALYYNGHVGNLNGNIPAGKNWQRVYWIDVLNANPHECSILDIETGDASPRDILDWVPARLDKDPSYICRLYSNLSTWKSVQFYVAQLSEGQRKQVRYWIANPTMSKHVVNGSCATQWYWGNMDTPAVNFDRSDVAPCWDA